MINGKKYNLGENNTASFTFPNTFASRGDRFGVDLIWRR
jgi:hypothetical protein